MDSSQLSPLANAAAWGMKAGMKTYQDHYFKKAKQENYPARSVYKLQELNNKFKLLRPGLKVLDLGAAPGSWSLFASQKIGERGRLIAVDLQEIRQGFGPGAVTLCCDAFSDAPELLAALADTGPLDLVMSDMAPATTGIKFADQARSAALCERARDLAVLHLKPGGNFVAKIFEGAESKPFMDSLKPHCETVRAFKPKSSRSESKETFILGLGFRPPQE